MEKLAATLLRCKLSTHWLFVDECVCFIRRKLKLTIDLAIDKTAARAKFAGVHSFHSIAVGIREKLPHTLHALLINLMEYFSHIRSIHVDCDECSEYEFSLQHASWSLDLGTIAVLHEI